MGFLSGRRRSLEAQQQGQPGRYLRHLQHPQQQHDYSFGWEAAGPSAGLPPAAAVLRDGSLPGGAPGPSAAAGGGSPRGQQWAGSGGGASELQEPLLGSAAGLAPAGPPSRGSSQWLAGGSNGSLSKVAAAGGSGGGSVGYPSAADLEGQPRLRQALLLVQHVALPVFVMLVGTAFSVGALWLSVAALFKPSSPQP